MINILEASVGVYKLVGVLYEVHRELGPGLNEYIYQEGLKREFELQGIPYQKEVPYHPIYKGQPMESEYRLDFLADDNYIIELKAVSALTDDHRAQLFNYMHLCRPKAGILINFAPKSCVIERYLFDDIQDAILTIDGKIIHRRK